MKCDYLTIIYNHFYDKLGGNFHQISHNFQENIHKNVIKWRNKEGSKKKHTRNHRNLTLTCFTFSLLLFSSLFLHVCRMNSGVCVCVILAALSVSCLGRPRSSSPDTGDSPLPSHLDTRVSEHLRLARSLSLPKQPATDKDTETRANLSQLLAKLISKKGETAHTIIFLD